MIAHDDKLAPVPIKELPDQARFVLDDTHYNTPEKRWICSGSGRFVVVNGRRGPCPHTDAGVEVRRIFHRLRHVMIENFNKYFRAVFECHRPILT